MAMGDVVSNVSSLSQYGYLTIQPGAGVEWIIHNLYFDQAVMIEFYNGSNSLVFEWVNDIGRLPWMVFHLTNDRYLRVQALVVGTTLVGYDGVASK